MDKDLTQKICLSDDERYADLVNGLLLQGEPLISANDLQEMDSQSTPKLWLQKKMRRYRQQYRDLIRKTAFGVNFALIGIENQEQVHYLMPLRVMEYDAAEYEKQAIRIRKKARKVKGLSGAEFMSGFRKNDRLYPCITIVLYYGEQRWDGSKELHGLLDFTDIPEKLRRYINNYYIFVFEISSFDKTDIFQTDIKQIFDFIRCSKDKNKLKELVQNDAAYQEMEEAAYDMIAACTDAEELLGMKKYYGKDGRVNMCRGLKEWLEDERKEGRQEGKTELLTVIIRKKIRKNLTLDMIADDLEEDIEVIRPIYEKAKEEMGIKS